MDRISGPGEAIESSMLLFVRDVMKVSSSIPGYQLPELTKIFGECKKMWLMCS
jgi:hypothetical protein